MPRNDLPSTIASSLDLPEELLPYAPTLLLDLEDLGARAVDVVALLERVSLPPKARVLDLGSGKGASALAVAHRFGAEVRGIDGLPAFVAHAEAEALRAGLAERVSFVVGDVRQVVRTAQDYDVVMLLALGDVLGTLPETVAQLLGAVKPGGYVLLDDAYLDSASLNDTAERAAAEDFGCYDRETSVRLIEGVGARVVGELHTDTDEMHAWLQDMTARVLERAEELAAERPDLAPLIHDFAVRQSEETQDLMGPLVGVLWLLQRV